MIRSAVIVIALMLFACTGGSPAPSEPVTTPMRRVQTLADDPPAPQPSGPAHWPASLVFAADSEVEARMSTGQVHDSASAREMLATQLAEDIGIPVVLATEAAHALPAPAHVDIRLGAIDQAIAADFAVLFHGVRDGGLTAPFVWITGDVATCHVVRGPDSDACAPQQALVTDDAAAETGDADAPVTVDDLWPVLSDGRVVATVTRSPIQRRYLAALWAVHDPARDLDVTRLADWAAAGALFAEQPHAIIGLPADELVMLNAEVGEARAMFALAYGPDIPADAVMVHRGLPYDIVPANSASFEQSADDPYRAATLLDATGIEAWQPAQPALIEAAATVARR